MRGYRKAVEFVEEVFKCIGYIEYIKKTKKDVKKDLGNYLRVLRDLANVYKGRAYIFGPYTKARI